MDPLSDVLTFLRPQAYVTGALKAGGAWALRLPAHAGIKCYLVVKGEASLLLDGSSEVVRMRQGSCVMMPHGQGFVMGSDLAQQAIDARVLLETVKRVDGVLQVTEGEEFVVLGCHFDLEGDAGFLLDVLPDVVVLMEEQKASLGWAIERLQREISASLPGGSLVTQQVAFALLVEALRMHLNDEGTGWLFALSDARMRSALEGMHTEPGREWSLQELAHEAGMSRTSFAQTFKRMVGEAPMAYLTRWRMTIAAKKVNEKREPISVIAPSLWYQSESAFSAAFKRQWGVCPREFMRAKSKPAVNAKGTRGKE